MDMQVNGQGHRWHRRAEGACLYCIVGLTPSVVLDPRLSVTKHWDYLSFFVSLLLQLVVFIYQCSHQQLYQPVLLRWCVTRLKYRTLPQIASFSDLLSTMNIRLARVYIKKFGCPHYSRLVR